MRTEHSSPLKLVLTDKKETEKKKRKGKKKKEKGKEVSHG